MCARVQRAPMLEDPSQGGASLSTLMTSSHASAVPEGLTALWLRAQAQRLDQS